MQNESGIYDIRKKSTKVQRCCSLGEYVEIFLLFVLTVGPVPNTMRILLYLFLGILNIKHIIKLKIDVKIVLLVLIMCGSIVIDIRNVDSITSFSFSSIAYFIPFVFSVLWVKKYSLKEFLYRAEKVAFFTVLCSYIGMFIVYYAPYIVDYFPIVNFYGRNVRTVGIFNVILDGMGTAYLKRSCGIAFEPGAYQFVVNIGLVVTISMMKRKNVTIKDYIRILVYIGGVILTRSSTGLIILGIVLGGYAISSIKRLVMVVVVCIVLIGPLMNSFEAQLTKMSTGNFVSRFENTKYVIDEYIFDEKFGETFVVGIGATGYTKEYEKNNRIGAWDVYTNYYLRYGVFFLFIFLYFNITLHKISWGLMCVVMMSLLTEAIVGPIIVMLYYYAINQKELKVLCCTEV